MTNKNLYFIGGGGHFKVAYEIAKLNPEYVIQGYFDDSESHPKGSYPYNETKHLGNIKKDLFDIVASNFRNENKKLPAEDYYFIAIGDNKIREKIRNSYSFIHKWATLIHPRAVISTKLENITPGTLICAGAVVEPGTYIGEFSIINTNASVNHDCNIGCFVHICPGATLCGTVYVGSGTMIGAGSTVIPKITIESNCIIGSGSNVVKDIRCNNSLSYGNPCKIIQDLENGRPLDYLN